MLFQKATERTTKPSTDEAVIIERLKNGGISSWIELHMHCDIVGIELDVGFVRRLMKSDGRMHLMGLIAHTLECCGDMDDMFEDGRMVDLVAESDGMPMYLLEKNGFTKEVKKFRTIPLLKKLDARRPRYLLKYCLGLSDRISVSDMEMKLLRYEKDATLKRHMKFKSDGNAGLATKFGSFHERLSVIVDEKFNMGWIMM